MTHIGSVSSTQSTTTTTSATAGGTMGKDAFLKLLVGQLKSQNPMSPMADQDFLGQMAQFSMLEQISNVAETTGRMADAVRTGQAVELLGRTVTHVRADGTSAEGVVERVDVDHGHARLTVAGETGIDPAAVTQVR